MRIRRIRLHRVLLPLRHRFQTSSHRKASLEHVLVEATDAEGRTGWGEIASPSEPYYCGETTDTAWLIAVRHLAPMTLAADWEHPRDLELAWSSIRGNEFARAGFSIAAWDLFARARERSLAQVLGGTRAEVSAGVSLGIEPSIDALLDQVQAQVAAGYRRVKLKIAPGWDREPVRAVRAAYPDLVLQTDANGAYPDTPDSFAALESLDSSGLTMIEQPFAPRAFITHARLQQRLRTRLCLDESVVTVDDLRTMIAMDAARVLNIKVSRMGGLGPAIAAHDVAVAHGIDVWCGGMHEFGVGRAANVALSSLPGFTLPSDVSGSAKYYERDILTEPVVAIDSQVQVPTTAGLGHDVDRAWLEANTTDSTTIPQETP